MKKTILSITALSLLFLGSCTKDVVKEGTPDLNNNVSNMNDLVVPANFTWENSRDVNLNINITDARFQELVHVISVYDENPLSGGVLITRGSATLSNPFNTQLNLANTINRVFVSKVSPDGSEISKYIDINSKTVNVDLAFTTQVGKNLGKTSSPDCSSGCTQTITTNNTNLNVSDGQVICVTASNITIGFNANGGTVKICGTNVTVQNANLNSGANLIITSTGRASFNNLNINGSTSTFQNWGTATVSGSFSPGGTVTNNGTITTKGDISLNSQSSMTNNGTITSGQSMNVNGNCTLTNNSSITVTQSMQVNGNGLFINSCYLWVKGNYENNGTTRNYGYIKVDNNTNINGGSEVGLYSGAMFKTKDLQEQGNIKGYVSTSLFKVTNNTTINGGAAITGFIQFCDLNGVETNRGTIGSGAALGCGLYLAVTTCNPEGNGTAPVPVNPDTDNDGVPDNSDAYPNDATKAYNNYYPSATGRATVAFEDQWPSKGDYDMNDVVISYRYNVVTNASNVVVQVNANYSLLATGGVFQNGFGVEFPINRANATGVTGGTLEAGQTKAVVTLFNNTRAAVQNWNTKIGEPTSDSVNYTVSFNVTSGPTLSTFGLGIYNPFIWNNTSGFGRGYEIHLPGKTPTTLANTTLFGTSSDNSSVSAGRYYVTKPNGLPWAINIPTKFDYPVERADINTAFTKFATWVQSNGTTFTDWYTNQSGYRNTNNIYSK